MIIALAAVGFKNGDTAYNKEKILETMREYSGKADLVLFGETFLQGFDSLSWNLGSPSPNWDTGTLGFWCFSLSFSFFFLVSLLIPMQPFPY